MTKIDRAIDADRAVERLMRFLAVEGVTGQEQAIGVEVVKALREAGVPASAIRYDTANERIPLPTQTGNLIVKLPGTRPKPHDCCSRPTSTRCRSARGRSGAVEGSASCRRAKRRWAATTARAWRAWSRWRRRCWSGVYRIRR